MNNGPSESEQIRTLIDELIHLNALPRRGVEPGFLSTDTLTDEVRTRVSGVIVEAKMLLDRNMGGGNEFSNALTVLRVGHPMPSEVQDLLQRALRYVRTSPPVSAAPAQSPVAATRSLIEASIRGLTHGTAEPLRDSYVHADRLAELRQLRSKRWDLARLIRLCEELNIAHRNECTQSVGMLLRAIKDHCPPIFGMANFKEVANNAAGVSQSRRKLLKKLDESLTHIADAFLHEQIRRSESLPTPAQVAFTAELDALLAEIAVAVKNSV